MRRLRPVVLALLVACGGEGVGGSSPPAPPPPPPPPPPAPVPTTLAIHAGNDQQGQPGVPLPVRPAAKVTDDRGQPFAGALVTFAVDTGGGLIDGPSATTNADGIATAGPWTLGPFEGPNRLRVSSGTLASATFAATGRLQRGTEPTTDVRGTVVLPAGTKIPLTSLRVTNTFGRAPVTSTGFTLPYFQEGPQFTIVSAPNGTPLLLGFVDADRATIDAKSTAALLAWYDVGAERLPNGVARIAALRVIEESPDLHSLVQAISSALTADSARLSIATPAIQDARFALRRRLLTPPPAGPQPGTKITPDDYLSGVQIADVLFQHVQLTNWYRRRAVAFVDRVSYLPKDGREIVMARAAGDPVSLGSINGLQSVVGGAFDILTGNLAWQPAVSPPLPTPLFPADARRTNYEVVVVGPGYGPADNLSAMQQRAMTRASAETAFLDVVLPIVSTTVKGLNALDKEFGSPEALGDLEKAIELLPSGAAEKAVNGDLVGAASEAMKALAGSGAFQEAVFDLILNRLAKTGIEHPGVLLKEFSDASGIIRIADVILGLSDVLTVVGQTSASKKVERWVVQVNASKVQIQEGDQVIEFGGNQLFHANVAEVSETAGLTVEYRWTTTGTVGHLTPNSGDPKHTTTPTGVVNYSSDLRDAGKDVVTVEAFTKVNGVDVSLGADTVSIEVSPIRVLLLPRNASIKGGERQTLTARVDSKLIGGVLSYRWTTTGKYGTFASGLQGYEDQSPAATFVARSATGADDVAVEVFSTQSGVRSVVGKARSHIKIEKRKSIFVGTAGLEVTSWPEGKFTRYCAIYFAKVPIVDSAKTYHIRAYGFYDPSYYKNNGASFTTSSSPPAYQPCSAKGYSVLSKNGGEIWALLSGGSSTTLNTGELTSRFTGIVVELEVEY